jgi:predicted outer membrane repeat protein
MRSERPGHLRILLFAGALLGALTLLVASPASSFPLSITVNCAPYGNDDLQYALDNYDVVNVRGTCFGNFSVNSSGKTINGATAGAGINGRGTGTDLWIAYGTWGTVTIQNMTFTNGHASEGGGIYLYGSITLDLINSTVKWNKAEYGGGGIYVGGGAVLDMTGTTVTRNSAGSYGGGIYAANATLSATASTISLNDTLLPAGPSPGNGGGGVYVENGDASLSSTKVTTNRVLGYGGGITLVGGTNFCQAVAPGAVCVSAQGRQVASDDPLLSELTLTNSSVDHNIAQFGDGGGIYSSSEAGDTSVTLQDSIVSFNNAPGGEGDADGGGIANYGECGYTASVLATGTAFQGNLARNGEGGALYNATGTACPSEGTALVTIGRSPVSNGNSVTNQNQARYGGGIANEQDGGVASVMLQPGANVRGNRASVTGGGVYNDCGSFSSLGQIMLNSPNNVVSVCFE